MQVILKLKMTRSLVNSSGLLNTETKVVTGCFKNDKRCQICSILSIRCSVMRGTNIFYGVFKDLRMRRSLVKLSGLVKSVAKMETRCLRATKSAIFAVYKSKGLFVKYEKYGTLSLSSNVKY